jgi:uncharacterized protein (TIGR03067 family)
MKPLVAAVLAGLIGLAGQGIAAQAPARTVSDSGALQGTWLMVSGAASGYSLPPEYVKSMRRVFTGAEVSVTMGQQLFFKATVLLDPAHSPKTIDYHMTGGPTAGAVQLGIYLIAGDTVRFCFAAPNAARPADFTTTPGDGRTLSTWVRAKP